MDLEQRVVVEVAEEVLGVQHRGGAGLVQEIAAADRAGGAGEGLPLDHGEDGAEEISTELHLILRPPLRLQAEREAIDDALDVAGEHVVGYKPHLAALFAGRCRMRACLLRCGGKQKP